MYNKISTKEEYDILLKSGMFWEFHPELSGDWEKDKKIILAGSSVVGDLTDSIRLYNMDCMELLKDTPDDYYDLAIVDPPYGIERSGQAETFTKNTKHKRKAHKQKEWDKEIPNKEYFEQLFRVSKNQIIWGGNYFTEHISSSMGWIFWDKGQDLSMSDGELAYTSFDRALRRVTINRCQLLVEGGTIHPTQKPIKLYKWVLSNYAKQGDKILDTHAGSFSIGIACDDMGFDLTATELDPEYYESAVKRFKTYKSQTKLAL